jgi:hypothetical protein
MPIPLRTRVAEFASQSEELTNCVERDFVCASPKAEVVYEKPPHRTVRLSNGEPKFHFISDVTAYDRRVKTRPCSNYHALVM